MGAVKSLQGGKSEVDKNIGDLARKRQCNVLKVATQFSKPLVFRVMLLKLGARGSRMESRLQRGNPLYLSCCEDRICFRKNTRLTIVEYDPAFWACYKDELGRVDAAQKVPSVASRGCWPASISYDGSVRSWMTAHTKSVRAI